MNQIIMNKKNNNIQPVSTYTAINSHKRKSKSRIWKKSVLMPFVCGALGTVIVIGTCFGVPTIREKIFTNNSNNNQETTVANTVTQEPQTQSGNDNLVSLSNYSETGVNVANKK